MNHGTVRDPCHHGEVPAVVRTYRGASAEERRADRRARLLAGCLDVVGEVGVVGVTVEAVCARAGLTKRYFYEAFGDRDAVLAAVADGVYADLHAATVAALRGAGGDERTRAITAVEVFAETLDANPPIASSTRTGIIIDLPTTQVIPSTDAAETPPAMIPLSWRFSIAAPECSSPTPANRLVTSPTPGSAR